MHATRYVCTYAYTSTYLFICVPLSAISTIGEDVDIHHQQVYIDVLPSKNQALFQYCTHASTVLKQCTV